MRHTGIEPASYGLKVRCIANMLMAQKFVFSLLTFSLHFFILQNFFNDSYEYRTRHSSVTDWRIHHASPGAIIGTINFNRLPLYYVINRQGRTWTCNVYRMGARFTVWCLHQLGYLPLMREVGFEPTMPKSDGVTARCDANSAHSPKLLIFTIMIIITFHNIYFLSKIYLIQAVGFEPTQLRRFELRSSTLIGIRLRTHYQIWTDTKWHLKPSPLPVGLSGLMYSTRLELAQGLRLTRLSFWRVFHSTTSTDTGGGSRTHKPKPLDSKSSLCSIRVRPQIRHDGLEPTPYTGFKPVASS